MSGGLAGLRVRVRLGCGGGVRRSSEVGGTSCRMGVESWASQCASNDFDN